MIKTITTEIIECDGCQKDATSICYYSLGELDFCSECISKILRKIKLDRHNYKQILEIDDLKECKPNKLVKPTISDLSEL